MMTAIRNSLLESVPSTSVTYHFVFFGWGSFQLGIALRRCHVLTNHTLNAPGIRYIPHCNIVYQSLPLTLSSAEYTGRTEEIDTPNITNFKNESEHFELEAVLHRASSLPFELSVKVSQPLRSAQPWHGHQNPPSFVDQTFALNQTGVAGIVGMTADANPNAFE